MMRMITEEQGKAMRIVNKWVWTNVERFAAGEDVFIDAPEEVKAAHKICKEIHKSPWDRED